MLLRSLLCTISAALLSASAHAQLIVGNDQSGTATIYDVDPATGVATPIHSGTTADAKPWGMAYDASTNTLYWNNGSTLFSSPLGPTLAPQNLGSMTFGAGSINFVALGFSNGKLYGTRNISVEAVYEIDPATLVATQVYVHNSSYDFGGLDWDATSGRLYGLTDAAPAPNTRGLYEIDLVAQTETFVAAYRPAKTDIDALAVHNGLAYYVTDGPNTTQASFYVIDVATGLQVGTIPSPFTGSGTFAAATWAGDAVPAIAPFCFGDGTGTPCPCGNSGAAGRGCANSIVATGSLLAASGTASVSNDTLLLQGTDMPNASALYFQGTTRQAAGLGVVFGDGLRCAGGTVIRLGTKPNVGGASQYPDVGELPVSVRGLVPPTGGTRTYQCWYRNAAAYCTVSTFNLTNGLQVVWVP